MIRFLAALLVFFSFQSFGQDYSDRESFDPDRGTETTKHKGKSNFDPAKSDNYPKKLEYFLISDPKKVLYGNPCVEEVIFDLGFKYMLIPETKIDGYINEDPVWHNFKTHMKLMFKNGPFYRSKVRKAIKSCRTASGDFVG